MDMRGKIYTKEFRETILQEANETNNIAQVARRYEISPKTIYSWKQQSKHKAWAATAANSKKIITYTPTAQEFKELETQNGQLKTLLGEKDLEIAIIRDVLKKAQPGYRTK